MRGRAVNVKKFSMVAIVLLVTNCIICSPGFPIERRQQVLTVNQMQFMKHFNRIRGFIKCGAFNSAELFNRASSRLTFLFNNLAAIDSFRKSSFPGSVPALEQIDISGEKAFSDYLTSLRMLVDGGILSNEEVADVVLLAMQAIDEELKKSPVAKVRPRGSNYAREEIKMAALAKNRPSPDAWCMFEMDDLEVAA
jgi:hypothetical protein